MVNSGADQGKMGPGSPRPISDRAQIPCNREGELVQDFSLNTTYITSPPPNSRYPKSTESDIHILNPKSQQS